MKLRQHLTFGYSEFLSLLEQDLTACALSTDLISRLLWCPSASPLTVSPCWTPATQGWNVPAEPATCAALWSVLCLVGLSRSRWSVTQAACTLLTLGNQDTTRRRHWVEQGCRRDCVATWKGGRSVPGGGYLGGVMLDSREPKLRHSFSGLCSNLQFT